MAKQTMSGIDDSPDNPFTDSDYYTGPPLTEKMIRAAESKLGYKLPGSYVDLLRVKNGGSLKRSCFPTQVPTSWAEDHLLLEGILGIGGKWGIDSKRLGSRRLIKQAGYPDVGVIITDMPSAGHDAIMLDYSHCGPKGEPRIIHVETETDGEPEILVLAPDFETFFQSLVDCSHFEDEEEW